MRRLKETIRLNQTNRCPGNHENFQKVNDLLHCFRVLSPPLFPSLPAPLAGRGRGTRIVTRPHSHTLTFSAAEEVDG